MKGVRKPAPPVNDKKSEIGTMNRLREEFKNNAGKRQDMHITVSVSATYAGEYYVPAADARLMYDDKVQGNSSSGHIVIE